MSGHERRLVLGLAAVLLVIVRCGGGGDGPAAPGDTQPPFVASVVPLEGSTNVAPDALVEAVFTERMDAASISVGTFFVVSASHETLDASVTYDDALRKAVLLPAQPLASNAIFTSSVLASVKDRAGNQMGTAKTWSFSTGSVVDLTAPRVVATSPQANATGVSLTADITATFDEDLDSATVTTSSFSLWKGASSVSGSVLYEPTARPAGLRRLLC